MVVDDLDILGPVFGPHETDTPLIINSDAVLPGPVSAEGFEAVTRWRPKVRKHLGCIQHCKLSFRHRMDIREFGDSMSLEQRTSI